VGARRLGLEGLEAALREIVDGIPHGLVVAAEGAGNVGGGLALGAGQEQLTAPDGKSGGGAEARLKRGALVRRQRSDK
jgi:hypothetical protein